MRGSFFACFFFFQAEDGIRDLVRSRGLGDVYKRQLSDYRFVLNHRKILEAQLRRAGIAVDKKADALRAVSYTHLTLPTSDLV